MKKILQIIPSEGWKAHFQESDGTVYEDDVLCFALIQDEDITVVEGMCGGDIIDCCEDMSNFIGYYKKK